MYLGQVQLDQARTSLQQVVACRRHGNGGDSGIGGSGDLKAQLPPKSCRLKSDHSKDTLVLYHANKKNEQKK